jgi:hypothetical protein
MSLELEVQARPVIEALRSADESELFEELGLRDQAVQAGIVDAQTFLVELPVQVSAFDLSVVRAAGEAYFREVAISTYPIICGAQNEERVKLAQSLVHGASAPTVLTSILISTNIVQPLLAPVVALIMLKIILEPTMAAFCRGLRQAIEKDSASH